MFKFLILIWFPILSGQQLEIYDPENGQNSLDIRERGIYAGLQNPGEPVIPILPNNYYAGVRLNPCTDRCSQRELPIIRDQLKMYHPENGENLTNNKEGDIYTGQRNSGEPTVPILPNNLLQQAKSIRLNPCLDRCSHRQLPITEDELIHIVNLYRSKELMKQSEDKSKKILIGNDHISHFNDFHSLNKGLVNEENKDSTTNRKKLTDINLQFQSLNDEELIDAENKDSNINIKKLTSDNNHFQTFNDAGIVHEDNVDSNINTNKLTDNNIQFQSLNDEGLVDEGNKDSSINTKEITNNNHHFQPLNDGGTVEGDNKDLSMETKKILEYLNAVRQDEESGDTSLNMLTIPLIENNDRFDGHNIEYQSDSNAPQSNKQAKQRPSQMKDYSHEDIGVPRDEKCVDKEDDQLRNDDLEPSRRFTSNVNLLANLFGKPNVPFFNEFQNRDTLPLNDHLSPKGLYNHRYDNFRNKFLESMKPQSNNNFGNVNKRIHNDEIVNGNNMKNLNVNQSAHVNNENALSAVTTMGGRPFTPAEIEGQLIEPVKGVGILDSVGSKIRVMESSRVCYACSSASDPTCSSPNRSTMVKYCRRGHDSCLTKTYQSIDEQQIVIRDCGSTCNVKLSIMNTEYKSCSICSKDLCNDEYVNSSVCTNSFSIMFILFLTVATRYAF